MANIPNKSDGEIFYASNLFKHITSNNAVTSSTSTSETEIGEATILANQASGGILIVAHIKSTLSSYASPTATSTNTFKIRVGTSSTATSNALVDTYVDQISQATGQSNNSDSSVSSLRENTISAFYSGATWSSENFVHITGQTNGHGTVECIKIEVIGV